MPGPSAFREPANNKNKPLQLIPVVSDSITACKLQTMYIYLKKPAFKSVSAMGQSWHLCGPLFCSLDPGLERQGSWRHRRQGWEYAKPLVYSAWTGSWCGEEEKYCLGSWQYGRPGSLWRALLRGQSSPLRCCLGRCELCEVSPEDTSWTGAENEWPTPANL